MPFAHRYDHTHEDFLPNLATHLEQLAVKHEQGFVVRLHVLGDFYSTEYVEFWRKQLMKHHNMVVYGYTHRMPDTDIGAAVDVLNCSYPDRWRVRFSDSDATTFNTVVIQNIDAYDDSMGIVCPEQLDKTPSCADCGLCWASEKPVVFLEH